MTTPLEAASRSALLAAGALRALATGMAGVLLGIYLAKVGLTPEAIGLVAGAGLTGAAAGALAVTLWGARWKRRAWLARRIGLVNTMVWTHLPSSLLLAGAALAPSFGIAAGLFVLREALVEMDVPTRQSYVMAVVRPEERTAPASR